MKGDYRPSERSGWFFLFNLSPCGEFRCHFTGRCYEKIESAKELFRKAKEMVASQPTSTGETDVKRLLHELQVHQVEMEMQKEEQRQTYADVDWQGTGTVLIVDDEESIRAIAGDMLEDMGFKVLSAVDGQNGLEVFAGHAGEIVCVLLDLTMPKMDGDECFRELRALRSNLPVLISSGYSVDDVSELFMGEECVDFVQKPYTFAQFKASMRKVTS